MLKHGTYDDDKISGAPSLEEALNDQEEIIQFLSRDGFQLKKWRSNHSSFLETIPLEDRMSDLDKILITLLLIEIV